MEVQVLLEGFKALFPSPACACLCSQSAETLNFGLKQNVGYLNVKKQTKKKPHTNKITFPLLSRYVNNA